MYVCMAMVCCAGPTEHLEVMDCYSIPNGVGERWVVDFYWRAGKVL